MNPISHISGANSVFNMINSRFTLATLPKEVIEHARSTSPVGIRLPHAGHKTARMSVSVPRQDTCTINIPTTTSWPWWRHVDGWERLQSPGCTHGCPLPRAIQLSTRTRPIPGFEQTAVLFDVFFLPWSKRGTRAIQTAVPVDMRQLLEDIFITQQLSYLRNTHCRMSKPCGFCTRCKIMIR